MVLNFMFCTQNAGTVSLITINSLHLCWLIANFRLVQSSELLYLRNLMTMLTFHQVGNSITLSNFKRIILISINHHYSQLANQVFSAELL